MKDFIPKGTGNSRYLKSNISKDTTLAQLIEMLNNGTLPIDINGVNPDGVTQMGTPLNKGTLLSDISAEKLGFTELGISDTATVNDAIIFLINNFKAQRTNFLPDGSIEEMTDNMIKTTTFEGDYIYEELRYNDFYFTKVTHFVDKDYIEESII